MQYESFSTNVTKIQMTKMHCISYVSNTDFLLRLRYAANLYLTMILYNADAHGRLMHDVISYVYFCKQFKSFLGWNNCREDTMSCLIIYEFNASL